MAKPKIFVSYSRMDTPFAAKLVADLNAAGADAWMDVNSMGAGPFPQRISEALASCEWFLVVLTPNALTSDWVNLEVNTAINLKHQKRVKELIFIRAEQVDKLALPVLWDTFNSFDAKADYTTALNRTLKVVGLRPIAESKGHDGIESKEKKVEPPPVHDRRWKRPSVTAATEPIADAWYPESSPARVPPFPEPEDYEIPTIPTYDPPVTSEQSARTAAPEENKPQATENKSPVSPNSTPKKFTLQGSQHASMRTICPHCHQQLPDPNAATCPHCGLPVNVGAEKAIAPSMAAQNGNYELGLIINPDVGEDRARAIVEHISQSIVSNGGQVVRVNAWGRRRLMYPIQHHRDGLYFFFDLIIPPIAVAKVERGLQVNEDILRHLMKVRDPKVPAQQRQHAVDGERVVGESAGPAWNQPPGGDTTGEHPALAEASSMFDSIMNQLRALLGRQPSSDASSE